jgi:hypothetical protein
MMMMMKIKKYMLHYTKSVHYLYRASIMLLNMTIVLYLKEIKRNKISKILEIFHMLKEHKS